MIPLSNLHTHTTFCDGKNTPEELVRQALELGMVSLGFSGHSFTPCDPSYCMLPDTTVLYRQEITRLKAAYAGQLEIYLGCERDYYTDQAEYEAPYDYIVGSVHYIFKDRRCLAIDHASEIQETAVQELYSGNWLALMRDYYEIMARMPARVKPDVIGHFDVITKFNEDCRLFDDTSFAYRALATDAMLEILKTNRLFEINTGAIARKKRSLPYPALFLLNYLREHGGEVLLSSDCHDKNYLLCEFEQAAALAREAGFTYAKVLRGGHFQDVCL